MEQMIAASIQLRDLMETDIQNTANDLEAQRLATNYAFRNRIHEVWSKNCKIGNIHQVSKAFIVPTPMWLAFREYVVVS